MSQIKVKLIALFPEQTGEGKNGTWKKQSFITETEGNYPKKIVFTAWNKSEDLAKLNHGDTIDVSFLPESREYKDKWYTDLTVTSIGVSAKSVTFQQDAAVTPYVPEVKHDDSLPF